MTGLTTMPKYEAYKDSGVEWLPSIPSHWNVKKTKYVAKLYAGLSGKAGKDFSKEFNAGFSIFIPFTSIYGGFTVKPIYQYVSIGKFEIQNKVENGDILFLMSSETFEDIAKCAIFQDDKSSIYLNSFCKGLRVFFSQVDKMFVNYLFKSDYYREYFAQVARGFTRINLKQEYIYNAQLLIPHIQEQTTIVNFLDKKTTQIDEAITIKQKQIELLKERKQILIQKAVTQGLDPNVPMRDSGVNWIGEIPEHWSILPNFALFTERVEPGRDELPLLSVSIHSGVSKDEMSEEENIRGRIKIADKTKYNLVKPNDIVFNMMRAWQGGVGSVSTIGMVSPAYIIATPNNKINAQYFEYQYRSSIFIQQMDRFSKGITDFRKRLYWDEFKRLNTVAPPIGEQKSIVLHIESSSNKIDHAISLQHQQIKNLKEYKTTLINSAVTGKIKIENGK